MTQLVFDAADAEEALTKDPVEVGYSSHEGAERAAWGDEKLEIVDGTHPVVYPAAGSHANKFTAALYLGSSADAGVGCDLTLGPHREVTSGREDDSERSRPRPTTAYPVDRLRGPLGRAAAGLLQRADRPEHEGSVDASDRVVAGLARPGVRGAGGRRLRHRRDRSVLQRCRQGLEGSRPSPPQPGPYVAW